uniref:Uncharacterized protein n=1 Tax=Glossina palpalis gambiensis TaxID=67801 RepID=A0A1B0BD50_9MUSC
MYSSNSTGALVVLGVADNGDVCFVVSVTSFAFGDTATGFTVSLPFIISGVCLAACTKATSSRIKSNSSGVVVDRNLHSGLYLMTLPTTLISSFLSGCIAAGFSLVTFSGRTALNVLTCSTPRRGLLSSNLSSLTISSFRGRLQALLK